MDSDMSPITSTKRKKNRLRFTNEQTMALEFAFESELRPEPRLKHQLANKLGLQPRQVAIWFQNRRARSKSKHIEQEYNILKARYDTLASKYEPLKRENQSLVAQLQTLSDLLGKTRGSTNHRFGQTSKSSNGDPETGDLPGKTRGSADHGFGQTSKSSNGDSETGDTRSESEEQPSFLVDSYSHYMEKPVADADSQNLDFLEKETDHRVLAEPTDYGSLSLSENLGSFDSTCFLDQSSCNSQWWELWP